MFKNITFYNWTTEDFTHLYANTPYIFRAGKRYSVPEGIAVHFAKHLAIRECHKQKDDALPKFKMDEYMAKCFPAAKPSYETFHTELEEINDKPVQNVEPQEFEEVLTSINPPKFEEVNEPTITPAPEKIETPAPAPRRRGRPAKTKEEEYLG